MERRVIGNFHARCGAGEKVEIASKLYLLLFMAPEEAEEFKPKAKPIGTTLSEAQHAKEKKGLQGEYKEGWEEATATGETVASDSKTPAGVKHTVKSTVNVEKTPEYLSYKKYFYYAGHQILIEDPSLSLEEIRKRMVKTFPELSKERTEMTYTPPVLPKKKGKKADEKTDDQASMGFESSVEDVIPSEELEKTLSEDEGSEDTPTDNVDDSEGTDDEKNEVDDGTVELSEKSEAKAVLLPSVVDGVERFGMVVPILKGARKGAIREADLVRIFCSMDDLVTRPTVRNLLVARDGLYEVRITPVGIFKVRLMDGESGGTEEVSEGVDLLVPLIPLDLFLSIRDFFVRFALLEDPLEVLARIYYDGQKYFAHVPHQVVSHTMVEVLDRPEDLACAARNTLVMEVHSHNVMAANFSGTDDRDELATGIYGLWGNLDRIAEKKASLRCRISCGGRYREIDIFKIVKGSLPVPRHLPDVYEVDQWIRKVRVRGGESVG